MIVSDIGPPRRPALADGTLSIREAIPIRAAPIVFLSSLMAHSLLQNSVEFTARQRLFEMSALLSALLAPPSARVTSQILHIMAERGKCNLSANYR
jgi:hypothetical protein